MSDRAVPLQVGWSWGVTLFSLLWVACEPAGQLTLVVQSDMKMPDDINEITLELRRGDELMFQKPYLMGPGQTTIPATLAIAERDGGGGPIAIRLIARGRNRLRVLRDVVTTIPAHRNARLELPVQWLCDGRVDGSAEGLVDTSCPRGETCVVGRCVAQEVESAALPTFAAPAVFGGGAGGGDGACMDVVACFAHGVGVAPDDACTVPLPAEQGEGVNVALVLPPGGDGICGPGACLVPLDQDPGLMPYEVGFKIEGERIRLPRAVCEGNTLDGIAGLAVSTACPTKTPSLPTCGPWSSVTSEAGVFDAGPPADVANFSCPQAEEGTTALCLHLLPELLTLEPAEPALDGLGELRVEVYAAATPEGEPLDRRVVKSGRINELPVLLFTDLPNTVYVRAGFFDGADTVGFDAPPRAGAWVGGGDGWPILRLDPIQLRAGETRAEELSLRALRRLDVTVLLAPGVAPHDDGAGFVRWTAFETETAATTSPVTGMGAELCVDLSARPALISGYLLGRGPHFLVASLDDFGLGSEDSVLWTVPGSVLSGSPGVEGWRSSARITLEEQAYRGEFNVELAHLLEPGQPPPSPFACREGNCEDGLQNGNETDVDCGGGCRSGCGVGHACAGPGDCTSRVCADQRCVAARCDDGVPNGTETDADCGGECAACADGRGCLKGGDCESGSCIRAICVAEN